MTFTRLKVKNPDYIAVSWLTPFKPDRYSGTRRTFLKAIVSGAASEVTLGYAATMAAKTGSTSFHHAIVTLQQTLVQRTTALEADVLAMFAELTRGDRCNQAERGGSDAGGASGAAAIGGVSVVDGHEGSRAVDRVSSRDSTAVSGAVALAADEDDLRERGSVGEPSAARAVDCAVSGRTLAAAVHKRFRTAAERRVAFAMARGDICGSVYDFVLRSCSLSEVEHLLDGK